MKHVGAATLFAGIVSLCFLTIGRGEDSQKIEGTKSSASLQEQIDALKEGQQRLERQLEEIKQLLEEKKARSDFPAKPTRASVISLNVHGEPFRGDPSARVVIMEYSDFDCSFCAKYVHEAYPLIAENYIKTGKIKYFFRDLPAPRDTNAFLKAQAARCAGEQGKFWEMHDWLFANQSVSARQDWAAQGKALGFSSDQFNQCLADEKYAENIRRSIATGDRIGLYGTPAFLIGISSEDGDLFSAIKTIHGVESYESLKAILDELLAKPASPK